MTALNLVLIAAALLAYAVAFGGLNQIIAIAFFAPFCITPYLINAWLAWRVRSALSHLVLAFTTAGYTAWFVYLYLSATVWHIDAQSALLFLFVGVYALPGLLPAWGLIAWRESRQRAKT